MSADTWRECMRRGDFEGAWRVSDRSVAEGLSRGAHVPAHLRAVWDGTPVEGRSVLVRCLHGLGDTVQFARYLPWLGARAAKVTLQAQGELLPLFSRMSGIGRLLPQDAEPGGHDVEIEVMELGHVFRSTLHTLPSRVPYLDVPPGPLARAAGPAVGLIWRTGDWEPRRSLPLNRILQVLPEGIEWHVLQRGPALAERPPGWGVMSGSDDVVRAAQVMQRLDLVISVDSFPAHLAGSLGVPVWTLLHEPADWRWMEGRWDSPWYPTMRLFRQKVPGCWDWPLRSVALQLRRWAAGAAYGRSMLGSDGLPFTSL